MAPSSNLISLLFFTTLVFSLQANARESQFFSKVPHFNNNLKETEVVPIPNNEAPVKKEQVAEFIPETDNSYGLYGHESGLNPPSSTTTTTPTTSFEPYKSESEETSNEFTNNNNYYSFNKDSYSSKQNELSDARLARNSYSSNNNYNNYFYDNTKDDNGFSDKKYTEGGYNSPMENQNSNNQKYYYNNNNNGERQGLSDTRFMEGGKYFYDVNSDKYNPRARVGVMSSENWYNNRGYFGNNNYENRKSMEGYQNQDVFEDDQEVFEP
ncbi:hypothetical protein PIB30_018829 [Stylosanthes scabra]|uniref:Protein E6 n=1 Tax=Stylosanthes scabra TaxID=79078 RepID=A0ABU6TA50_9FABA|nr:hypothetical protein [Stylosanthes scabra]